MFRGASNLHFQLKAATIQEVMARTAQILFVVVFLTSQLGMNSTVATATTLLQTDPPTQYLQSALVLVNAQSPDYLDFEHFIQPYLDHFGIPYTMLDISSAPVTADVNQYALLIVGHRNLDAGETRHLTPAEEGFISAAVDAGSGLVNFDDALSADGTTGRYDFVADVFGFSYNGETSGSDVTFGNPATNYIIANHSNGEVITTATMKLAGIILPAAGVTSLVSGGGQPLLAVASPIVTGCRLTVDRKDLTLQVWHTGIA